MLGSVQDKLLRVRPPRVKLTYDVETGGAQEKVELPFVVGIFSDLTGHHAPTKSDLPTIAKRKFVEVDPDTFPGLMEKCRPSIDLILDGSKVNDPKIRPVRNLLDKRVEDYAEGEEIPLLNNGTGNSTVEFTKMEHFEPEFLIKRIEPMARVYKTRASLRAIQSKCELNADIAEVFEDSINQDGEEAKAAAKKIQDEFSAFAGKYAKSVAKLEKEIEQRKTDNKKPFTEEEENKRLIEIFGEDGTAPAEGGAVEKLCAEGGLIQHKDNTPLGYKMIADFSTLILEQAQFDELTAKLDKAKKAVSLSALIDAEVSKIDEALGRQLDEILHNEEFKAREATWRGLAYLLNNTETSATLKLKVFNISKPDLEKELENAVEFDQSTVFKLVYEAEYGTYGGHPFSMLMGDFEFDRSPTDQKLLKLVSEIAAAAHAPFVAAARAKLFDMESFEKLAKPRDLEKIFESVELAQWHSFRESEDSRYVTLALPRVLFRLPWGGEKGTPVDIINYEEDVMAFETDDAGVPKKDHDGHFIKKAAVEGSNLLWGNAAWVLSQRITNAHALYGWTAAIRGVEGGGLVDGLPTYTYTSSDGDVELVCPTQVTITDRREKELNDLGFMAICHCKGSAKAAFFGGQSANQPKKYLVDAATANAQLSSQLPYMLCASRFAHYIKVMMRQKVGSFMTKQNVEDYLNTWIAQYVLLDDNATQASKATYPLRQANVVATENADKPGSYNATVFIRPHFQLEELTASIRLVAEIPG